MGKTNRKERDPFTSGKKKKAYLKQLKEGKNKKHRQTFKDYIKE